MQQVPSNDPFKDRAVRRLVFFGHQNLELMNLGIVDDEPKELFQHDLNHEEAQPMSDMLEHGPTFQAVEVSVQSPVLFRNEFVPTAAASLDLCAAFDDLPLDSPG
jgi:hypothetical protein